MVSCSCVAKKTLHRQEHLLNLTTYPSLASVYTPKLVREGSIVAGNERIEHDRRIKPLNCPLSFGRCDCATVRLGLITLPIYGYLGIFQNSFYSPSNLFTCYFLKSTPQLLSPFQSLQGSCHFLKISRC